MGSKNANERLQMMSEGFLLISCSSCRRVGTIFDSTVTSDENVHSSFHFERKHIPWVVPDHIAITNPVCSKIMETVLGVKMCSYDWFHALWINNYCQYILWDTNETEMSNIESHERHVDKRWIATVWQCLWYCPYLTYYPKNLLIKIGHSDSFTIPETWY